MPLKMKFWIGLLFLHLFLTTAFAASIHEASKQSDFDVSGAKRIVLSLPLALRPSGVHPNAVKQSFAPSLLSMCPKPVPPSSSYLAA
ncbi:hypothetical protein ACROYT_G025340 [Oculina patagonica]